MKKQYIAGLQEGDVVNDYYIATRKDLRDTQSGGKFLGMVFKDKTGEIGGVMWNNAVSVASLFELGDVVNVRATVSTYQSRLQLRVDQVLPLKEHEYEPNDLICTGANTKEALDGLITAVRSIEDPWLSKLVEMFLQDEPFMQRLSVAAAGKKWHHAYRGGLVQHCWEMARLAELMCQMFPNVDRDLLMAGVFLHDIGKLDEMSHDLFTEYTTAGKLIGHLQIGCDMMNKKIAQLDGFPEHLRIQLMHLILSHHGEYAFGSPVLPKSLEAIVLYHIDNLDAQANAFTRVIDETREKRQEWSDFIGQIDRQIWAKEP